MQVLARCLASRSPRSATHCEARPPGWALGLTLMLLTAHPRAAQVTLAWNPSPSAGVDGYRVHYGSQSGAYTASFDVGLVTTTTVTGLSSGQTYYFAVTAYDRTDGVESAVSNEVSKTLPLSGSPAPTPPSGSPAPGGLITLEAEAMALTGYLVESNADASGEALIRAC